MDGREERLDSQDSEDDDVTKTDSAHHIKVLVIGAANSGKTTLIQKYITGQSPLPTTTLCIDVNKASVHVDFLGTTHQVTFFIYDMAGMAKFQNHNRNYYSDVFAVLFVFDVSCKLSLDSTIDWLRHYSEYCEKENIDPHEKLLICNKCDLPQQIINRKQLFSLAEDIGMTSLFETSALTGRNVDPIFSYIATQYLSVKLNPTQDESG